MEEKTMLKEILNALNLFASDVRSQITALDKKVQTLSEQMKEMNDRFEAKFEQMNERMQEMNDRFEAKFEQVNERMQEMNDRFEKRIDRLEDEMKTKLNRMETKWDGWRVEWIETQETVDFFSRKTLQHEQKIRKLSQQR
ncbi:LA_3659 family protein [Anoxybacteroides amylolyticum]|uniref:Putative synaptonemal complex 1 n=1 Tax=Anoxybacteroides amylolyticum TaxID=294699 RepID=A0A160F2D9_9BACL|nr:hypothetical protein [Anoxybacillus amylolyticus]ANB60051.1 putative synaptonemal complex 1 [Anoxybacillus amylolyticus]